jgi:amidophosphoribosyltransferase
MLAEQMATNGLEDAALQRLADAGRGVQLRVHGRAERLRGSRPARHPAAVDRTPAQQVLLRLETCALDIVGATLVRDVEPGELVRIDDRACTRRGSRNTSGRALHLRVRLPGAARLAPAGRSVHEARREMGRLLAEEAPVEADMVIAVPQTAHAAAQGYAEFSGCRTATADQEQLRGSHVHPAISILRTGA